MIYPTFAEYVLYPLFQTYMRRDTLHHLKELEMLQWLPHDKIKKLQWKKLKKLLEYAYANVPYYHRIFKSLNMSPKDIVSPKDFRKLPLLDKEKIRNNLNSLISSSYTTKDLIYNSTGGSTGFNLHFFNDRKSSGYVSAIVLRNNRWAGLEIGDKNALLWGSPFDISLQESFKNKIYNKLFRTLYLSSYNLSEENMFIYAKRLLRFKPKVIIGYPSSLYHFVKFLKENEIKGINPKSVISSAEALYDYQRELIESVLGCKVFNRYGCREFSAIAHECHQHSGMHINDEHVYVECLKENEEPAMPGETGELVITDLDNYAMPFIRYRICDIGVLSDGQCNCGRGLTMLEKVEGRVFDVIVCSNGRAVGGTFWTLLIRTAIRGIKQFQVIQESINTICVKVIPEENFQKEQLSILSKKIREYLGEDMNVDIQVVDQIPLTKSGKHRFVISNVYNSYFWKS